MANNVLYYVEGECEEKLINALKEEPRRIVAGKVKVFNAVNELLTKSQLLTIQAGTRVVFVFDTDVSQVKFLKQNIALLKKYCNRISIVSLMQVLNLEDELLRCSNVKNVKEITKSKSSKDFKRDFCRMSNCRQVLDKAGLKVEKLWCTRPPEEFAFLELNGSKIKLL